MLIAHPPTEDERPECARFIKELRCGISETLSSESGISLDGANKQLEFMKEFGNAF